MSFLNVTTGLTGWNMREEDIFDLEAI